jgi:hypothetical protein
VASLCTIHRLGRASAPSSGPQGALPNLAGGPVARNQLNPCTRLAERGMRDRCPHRPPTPKRPVTLSAT